MDGPVGTITCKDHHAIVTAHFIDQQYGTGCPTTVDKPCGSILTKSHHNLVSVHLLNPQYAWPMYDVNRPCPTIIARQDKRPMYAIFTPVGDCSLADTADDTAVMQELKQFCRENDIADVKMRMLRIDELLLIMGFPSDYVLVGTKGEQRKYIGNAVEVNMSRVLCEALCQRLSQ